MTRASKITENLEHVAATLASTREQLQELERQEKELRDRLTGVRGTRDMPKPPPAQLALPDIPPIPHPPRDLRAKIQAALGHESLGLDQLVRTVAEPAGKVVDQLRVLRGEGKVTNVGSAEHPIWSWRIGDNTSTTQLRELIIRLLKERPMTSKELMDATGARQTRVGGVVVEIQRDNDIDIRDLGGTHSRAKRWFILSDRVRDAKLAGRFEPKTLTRRRRRSTQTPTSNGGQPL